MIALGLPRVSESGTTRPVFYLANRRKEKICTVCTSPFNDKISNPTAIINRVTAWFQGDEAESTAGRRRMALFQIRYLF